MLIVTQTHADLESLLFKQQTSNGNEFPNPFVQMHPYQITINMKILKIFMKKTIFVLLQFLVIP